MKYRLLTLLAASLLLFSPALAEMPETEDDAEASAQEEQIAIDTPTLTQGMAGEEITRLQQKLSALGYYDGEITGSYGDLTKAAVKAFQSDFSLLQTGEADAETQEMIHAAQYRPLRLGSMGEDVRQLQIRLTALGYYEGKASGTYLPATQEAVALFQRCCGETATGLADLDTLTLLYAEDVLTREAAEALQPEATPAPTSDTPAGGAPEATPAPMDEEVLIVPDGEDDVIFLTPAPTVAFKKQLKYESKGETVKDVQRRLTELGYYEGNISGNFLGHTRNAVKALQTKNSLKADGIVGEATWNVLFNDPDVRGAYDDPKPTPEPTPIPYHIVVDVQNQVTTVYGLDDKGEYTRVVRQMLCSTGTKGAPSDVGDWVLSGRTARWCTFPNWGDSKAQYWTKINGSIAFHSVIYNTVNTMDLSVKSYNKLGQRASHGCIRLTVADARWIYNNCGKGVVVTITEKLPADPELRAALKLPALNKNNMLPYVTATPTAAPMYVSGTLPYELKQMKKNSKGEDVFWLQSKLKELGYYNGHIGGTYLDGTVNAVKAFQKDHGLKADGVAGEATLRLIYQEELATPTPAPTATPSPTPTATPTPSPTPSPTPTLAPTATPEIIDPEDLVFEEE